MDEKATQLHAIASLKVLLDATKPQDGANGAAAGANSGEQANAGSSAQEKSGGAIGVEAAHDSGRASQGTEVRKKALLSVSIFHRTRKRKKADRERKNKFSSPSSIFPPEAFQSH